MFGHAFFGERFFGERFFGDGPEGSAEDGTAIPRIGGAVTAGGGSVGLAAARDALNAAVARAAGTPATPR